MNVRVLILFLASSVILPGLNASAARRTSSRSVVKPRRSSPPRPTKKVKKGFRRRWSESPIKNDRRRGKTAVTDRFLRNYEKLSRVKISSSKYIDARYRVSAWRDRRTKTIFEELTKNGLSRKIVEEIELLKPLLSRSEVGALLQAGRVLRANGAKELYRKSVDLIADYGEYESAVGALGQLNEKRGLMRLGPRPIRNTDNIRRTDILDDPNGIYTRFTNHEFTGRHSIRFRGLEFKTGDFIVTNVRAHNDGFLTGFMSESAPFTHSGLFVVLTRTDGLRVPAVLEMRGKGNRLVPIADFVGPDALIAEVYRIKSSERQSKLLSWRDKIRDEVVKMQRNEIVVYDFQSRENKSTQPLFDIKKGVKTAASQCVELVALIYRRAGVNVLPLRTPMTPGAVENLESINMPVEPSVATPFGMIRTGLFSFVGTVDNRLWKEDIAHKLILGGESHPGSVMHLMSHGRINLWGSFKNSILERIAIGFIQRPGYIGRVLRWFAGFKDGEVPQSAPPHVLSWYLGVGKMMNSKTLPTLLKESEVFQAALGKDKKPIPLFSQLKDDPAIRNQVKEIVKRAGIHKFFRSK